MVSLTIPTDLVCDILLVSNAAPDLSLAYQEAGNSAPTHVFTRHNASSSVVHEIAGRRAPIGFRTTEGRSDVQTRTLIIAAQTTPTTALASDAVDRLPFEPLIGLIEEPALPYVALIDGREERWFTFPEIVGMAYDWRAQLHKAELRFTTVSIDPLVLTVDVPWTP